MTQINPDIVAKRKQQAPKLKVILDKTKEVIAALDGLEKAAVHVQAPKQDLMDCIVRGRERLEKLTDRAELRHKRFNSGLISVAVGGIEKSGKTTLLKTLTGITTLPTANERCTAVCCEIIYDSKNTFDLEFHDDSGFCKSILHPLCEAFNKSLADKKNNSVTPIAAPHNLNVFKSLVLPSLGSLPAGTDSWTTLEALTTYQSQVTELQKYIGTISRRDIALNDLSGWVANTDDAAAKARVASVSRCIIYIPFQGGSENLRWIDTPGVDDPSPLARERTLRAVGQDADLLVVATMPRDKPSITNSFVNFWTSIHNLGDEVDLMQRLLVFLNWKRDADPDKVEIEKHRGYLESIHQVLPNLFCGPLEANKLDDVEQFMDSVNRHLSAHLPGQDSKVVELLENELKSALAEIRTSVFDVADRLSPSDSGQADVEMGLFLQWFNRASAAGKQTGFWPHLRELFVKAVREVPRSEGVTKAQSALDVIFNKNAEKIHTELPDDMSMEAMRNQTGDAPIGGYMQTFSTTYFSNLINDLAKQVGDFGPVMQQAILQVFREAGLEPLLPNGDPQETLRQFHATLSKSAPISDEKNTVLEALEELASLKQSLQYVYRWEMRPAINFLSPLHWGEGKAVHDLAHLLDQGEKSSEKSKELRQYFDKNPIPGIQEPPKTHACVFEHICKFALIGVKIVLDGGRCRLDNIADDFVRDFQTRLTFAAITEEAWRDVLLPHRGALVGSQIAAIRANSEKLRQFRLAVEQLSHALP